MKLSSICSIGAVGAVSLITLGISAPAHAAGFVGEFNPTNTLGAPTPGAGFSINNQGTPANYLTAPNAYTITDPFDSIGFNTIGGANPLSPGIPASAEWLTIPIASAYYIINFDWAATGVTADRFFYSVNGTPTQLNLGTTQTGNVSLFIPGNTSFGFRFENVTAQTSSFDVTSFSAVGVPWETDALPVLGTTILFGAGVWAKQKFKKVKFQK